MVWLSSDRYGVNMIEWGAGKVTHEEALIEELGTRAWLALDWLYPGAEPAFELVGP